MTLLINPACGTCSCAGGAVWAAGLFTVINGLTRRGFARLNADGSLYAGFTADVAVPDAGGICLAYDATNGWLYLGGAFTTINGTARVSLARVDPTTGALDTTWDPQISSNVNALLIRNGLLYVGGLFLSAGGSTRRKACAFNLSTGALDSWDPNVTDIDSSGLAGCEVFALAAPVDGSVIYMGGDFVTVGASTRNCACALDPTTAAVQAWNPNVYAAIAPEVDALMVGATSGIVYLGGFFTKIGGAAGTTRNSIASLDSAGVLQAFDPNSNNQVRGIEESSDGLSLLVAGDFTTIGGQSRTRGARLDATAGTADSFSPSFTASTRCIHAVAGSVLIGGSLSATFDGIGQYDSTVGTKLTTYHAIPDGRVNALLDVA